MLPESEEFPDVVTDTGRSIGKEDKAVGLVTLYRLCSLLVTVNYESAVLVEHIGTVCQAHHILTVSPTT